MRIILGLVLIGLVAGCAGREEPRQLMNIRSEGSGPDEFSVVPNEPLEIPDNIASAELPTPGGDSRVVRSPDELVVTAFGGRATSGVNDQATLNAVSRFGVTDDIRGVLAAEDEQFRTDKFARPLERLVRVNVYFKFYEDQSLNSYDELNRMRRLGVRTPTAPPPAE
ncbi:MAG: DUF3035 domain-containing protein [Pseudomonadota bacterium]